MVFCGNLKFIQAFTSILWTRAPVVKSCLANNYCLKILKSDKYRWNLSSSRVKAARSKYCTKKKTHLKLIKLFLQVFRSAQPKALSCEQRGSLVTATIGILPYCSQIAIFGYVCALIGSEVYSIVTYSLTQNSLNSNSHYEHAQ